MAALAAVPVHNKLVNSLPSSRQSAGSVRYGVRVNRSQRQSGRRLLVTTSMARCGLAYTELCAEVSQKADAPQDALVGRGVGERIGEAASTITSFDISQVQTQVSTFARGLIAQTPSLEGSVDAKTNLTSAKQQLGSVKEAFQSLGEFSGLTGEEQSQLAKSLQTILDNLSASFSDTILSVRAYVPEDVTGTLDDLFVASNVPWLGVVFALLAVNNARIAKARREKEARELDIEKKRKALEASAKARSSKERASMIRDRERAKLKAELLRAVEMLGENALKAPSSPERENVERQVVQLESMNRSDKPLVTQTDMLLGEWTLVYASRGTTVTRAVQPFEGLDQLSIPPPDVTVDEVRQSLRSTNDQMQATNQADYKVGPFGTWRVSVDAEWQDKGDGKGSQVAFSSLSIVPTQLFGFPLSIPVPEFRMPVPESMRAQADWTTTYIDAELRVGRGEGDKIFLFRRAHSPFLGATSTSGVVDSDAGGEGMVSPNVANRMADGKGMEWTKEALADLNRAPFFVKDAAKKKAEDYARSVGATQVTMEVVKATK